MPLALTGLAVLAVVVVASVSGCLPSSAAYYDPVEVHLEGSSGSECGPVTRGRHRIRFYYPAQDQAGDYAYLLNEVTPMANDVTLLLSRPDGSGREIAVNMSAYTGGDGYYFTTIEDDIGLREGTYCLSYSESELSESDGAYFSLSGVPNP